MMYLGSLVEALRGELQQYGETLARFEDAAVNHSLDAAEGSLVWVKALLEQEEVLRTAIRERAQIQSRLARELGLPQEAGLALILRVLPPEHQLLVCALKDENDELRERTQRCAEQRRQLLRQSLHLMEKCLVAA